MTSTTTNLGEVAVLDPEHVGDIRGALGTIAHEEMCRPHHGSRPRSRPCWPIVGPGLIVMVGDNDAGAFGTYIGASAVGLATAYAGADVLGVSHSLHRPGPKGQGLLRLLRRAYGPRWRPGPVAAANNDATAAAHHTRRRRRPTGDWAGPGMPGEGFGLDGAACWPVPLGMVRGRHQPSYCRLPAGGCGMRLWQRG